MSVVADIPDSSVTAARPQPAGPRPLYENHFYPVVRRGVGDPGNAYCHAMQWYNGCLYFGFTRHTLCGSTPYERSREMSIWPVKIPRVSWEVDWRAQIWRFDPASGKLENVHLSDMAMGSRGFEVPRQIGFREMRVFKGRSDSRPALYAVSWGSHMGPGPHVLRSEGGRFEETEPQNPELFGHKTLRPLAVCRDKIFTATAGQVGGSDSDQRAGMALVSEDPASGHWEPASEINFGNPCNMTVFEMEGFGDWLYATTVNPYDGLEVWRTDAEGKPPYRWQKVISGGAGRGKLNEAGLSPCLFNGALYVGTGIYNCGYDRIYNVGPAQPEILRIWPDGSWDLVVGEPRITPQGLKVPLSGFGPGLNNPFCGYIWRLCVHDGWLYVGTCVWSPWLLFAETGRWSPEARQILTPEFREKYVTEHGGFDLWRSRDGERFEPVTQNGFGNPYNCGARTMISTPHGLFVGTANQFGPKVAVRRTAGWRYEPNDRAGAEVWLGTPDGLGTAVEVIPFDEMPKPVQLPALVVSTEASDSDLIEDFYEYSGWRHVGFWREGINSARLACENLVEELLAFSLPDEEVREPRIPSEEEFRAWAASRPHRPWRRCEAVLPARPMQADVLDLGCGTGASTRYLLKHFEGPGLVGVTWTKQGLTQCRQRAGEGMRFLRWPWPRLVTGGRQFDRIICVEGLAGRPRNDRLLREVLSALKPGGYFLWADYFGFSVDQTVPTGSDLTGTLLDVGFVDVRVADVTEPCATRFRRELMTFCWAKSLAGQADEEDIEQARKSAPNGGDAIAAYFLVAARRP